MVYDKSVFKPESVTQLGRYQLKLDADSAKSPSDSPDENSAVPAVSQNHSQQAGSPDNTDESTNQSDFDFTNLSSESNGAETDSSDQTDALPTLGGPGAEG